MESHLILVCTAMYKVNLYYGGTMFAAGCSGCQAVVVVITIFYSQ